MRHYTDPVLSRIQASVESSLRRQHEEAFPDAPTDIAAPDGEGGGDLSSHPRMLEVAHLCSEYARRRGNRFEKFPYHKREVKLKHLDPHAACLELYCRLAMARLYGDRASYAALKQEFEFSTCDPQWFEAVEKYFGHFGLGHSHNDIPYVEYEDLNDFVCDGLPDDLTIGVLGDWGTGQRIAIEQLRSLVAKKPDLIIHLGDIYYAGTEEEYDHRLRAIIEKHARDDAGNPIPFLNMPGNHDMYAGGEAFYNAFSWMNARNACSKLSKLAQGASYFCLRTQGQQWQLIAMDTSYHDHDPFLVDSGMTRVREREQAWMLDKVKGFPGKTILLSHHQPFSPYEEIGSMERKSPSRFYQNPHLVDLFKKLQAAAQGDVCLWIWGHEHNLGIYEPFAGIERGRCVGHSAVPVLNDTDPYATRTMSIGEAGACLFGLARGHWEGRVSSEIAFLGRLLLRKQSVRTPELVKMGGAPVMLPKTPDGNMYEHGFTIMKFGSATRTGGCDVDYFAGDPNRPIFSESIETDTAREA